MTERLPDGFLDALHEADEHIQRTTPPRQEARDRLLRELRAEAERPAPLALLTPPQWGALAAAAAVAVAFGAARFMVSDHGSTSPPPPRDAAPVAATQDASWAGEGLSSSTCAGTAAPERGATKLGEGCTFAWLEADAELVAVGEVFVSKRAERELQVHGGTMRFTIDHERDKTTPVLVHVSGGTIEVVGTVFVVSEDAEAKTGHVSLERGAITFTNTAGEVTTLAPGDSLSWGDPPSADESAAPQDQDAAPTPTPTADAEPERKRRKPKKKRTAAQLERDRELTRRELDEVQNMRRLGQHGAALKKLRDLEGVAPDVYTREVISYEIGDILTHHRSKKKACSHWSRHTRRFRSSIYKDAVATQREGLGCR